MIYVGKKSLKKKKKKGEKETKHIIQFLLHSPTTTNQQSKTPILPEPTCQLPDWSHGQWGLVRVLRFQPGLSRAVLSGLLAKVRQALLTPRP